MVTDLDRSKFRYCKLVRPVKVLECNFSIPILSLIVNELKLPSCANEVPIFMKLVLKLIVKSSKFTSPLNCSDPMIPKNAFPLIKSTLVFGKGTNALLLIKTSLFWLSVIFFNDSYDIGRSVIKFNTEASSMRKL